MIGPLFSLIVCCNRSQVQGSQVQGLYVQGHLTFVVVFLISRGTNPAILESKG